MAQSTDLSKTPKDWDKMSNVDKYKERVAIAYGKERPKYFKQGLAVAQGLDAKQSPKKENAQESCCKVSVSCGVCLSRLLPSNHKAGISPHGCLY